MSEEELRVKGYPKTPDVKLESPILVYGKHVVNWIESKASFGDETSHNKNKDQFYGYKNRYGPGMVIYWFGFIDELQADQTGILLVDDFPATIMKLETTYTLVTYFYYRIFLRSFTFFFLNVLGGFDFGLNLHRS